MPMSKTRQGTASLSAPTKELQRLVLAGTRSTPMFRHGGNPAVRWQVDNFAVQMDPAGNVKPDKAQAADKIDAVAAGDQRPGAHDAHRGAWRFRLRGERADHPVSRSRLIRRALRDRFVVTMTDGETFEGILRDADDRHLVLVDAAPVDGESERRPIDGELFLQIANVRYMQRPKTGA
jgi:small nuclear ribonucleoprotein (snRNP)-like protein